MKTRLIGVGGGSGSGKTTVAVKIHEHYKNDSVIISCDNYYKDLSHLSVEERAKVNFDHPDSIDFELFAEQLKKLKNGESVDIPTYDFNTHSKASKTIHIDPKPMIIVEGILVLHSNELAPILDIKIYVKAPITKCLSRRILRDVNERGRTENSVLQQYEATVKPMFDLFVKPTSKNAHLVIDNALDTKSLDVTPVIKFIHQPKNEICSTRTKICLTKTSATLYYTARNTAQQNDALSSNKLRL